MGPAASRSLPRGERYSGYRSASTCVPYGALTRSGRRFHAVPVQARVLTAVLQPRRGKPLRFGLVRVRSPLLTESRFLSSPPGTEMFQFPGFARGFRDQSPFDGSPGLFAAFHALEPPGAKTSPTRPY